MAGNVIEKFFIDIELNTKGVGTQAKQIDKTLDALGSKTRRRSANTEKSKRKGLKGTRDYERYVNNQRSKEDRRLREQEVANGRTALAERLKQFKRLKQERERLNANQLSDHNRVEAALRATNERRIREAIKREKDLQKVREAAARRARELSEGRARQERQQREQQAREQREFYRRQQQQAAADQRRAALRQQARERARNRISIVQNSSAYQSMRARGQNMSGYDARIATAARVGDAAAIRNITTEMRNLNRAAATYGRRLGSLNRMQRGLGDSAQNMVRSYLSVFALFQGTTAIKRVGQDFEAIEASMLASSGSIEAAATDMLFLNGIVDKMGLSLKDTTDAWVKFKFAAKGKITQGQQEDIFEGLSMFGTALKVDNESMKRSQKALIQIDDYCLAA